MRELGAAQEAVAKERARLEALQQELKARRTEVATQVCAAGVACMFASARTCACGRKGQAYYAQVFWCNTALNPYPCS